MATAPEILKEKLRTESERPEAALVRDFWRRIVAEREREEEDD